jgi:hypothetical protein
MWRPNPKGELVCCTRCGRDTRRRDAMCNRCVSRGGGSKGPPRIAEQGAPSSPPEEDDEYIPTKYDRWEDRDVD